MADIELKHSAKGSTWQKKGAAYISRVKKNGKWVYTYASNKAGQAGRAVSTGASNVANTVSTAAGNAARSASSATSKNIAKGKARVNAILERLRGTARNARAKAVSAKLNREYKKKYVTNRERDAKRAGKNRAEQYSKAVDAAGRLLYENNNKDVVKAYKRGQKPKKTYEQYKKDNAKKYKKQADAQKHTKRVIAREQAIGKAKKAATNAYNSAANTASNAKKAASDTYKKKKKAAKRNYKKFERKALAAQRAYRKTQ